jgi:hypothetical protein
MADEEKRGQGEKEMEGEQTCQWRRTEKRGRREVEANARDPRRQPRFNAQAPTLAA